jgi:RNA polymerase sigma factor (sigma-70 family)
MPTGSTTRVIAHLRQAVLPRDAAALGDGELLGRFIERHDEVALAALVERHGPMVWGVCRRLLSHHDAEDAFQATFIVLVRKAASIVPREMVGNWLYGVAHQSALQARRITARRKAREVQVTEMPDIAAVNRDLWPDLQPLLDEELSRLPDIYRVVIVLCDLEGRTRKEIASQLNCPEGTVAGRLARARAMLAKRLDRRGITLSAGALTMVLSQNASACVPPSVVSNTIGAASLLAAGRTAAGAISPKVATLTDGVLKAMLMSKLKTIVAVVLLLGVIATGAIALSGHIASARENQPPAADEKAKVPPKPDREGAALHDLAGAWQGDDWGTVVLRPAKDGGFEGTYSDTFGKDVGRIAVRWSTASRRYEGTWSEGTYRFGRIALDTPKDGAISGAYTTDPKCEHQPGVPSLASLRWSKKKEKDAEKEPFTAWGKEINGLQAGLGFRLGEMRAYRHGETVTLVVRVRNVGKKEVKFQYLRQYFIETPPAVTDSTGKPIRLPADTAFGIHLPVEVTLAPGKEIELYEWQRELRPAKWLGNDGVPSLYGTGTFTVQYERVFGNSSSGSIKIDLDLSKFATGKLELEVKEEKKPD